MTAEFLGINIPLMTLAFLLLAGPVIWMVLKHPDRHPRETRSMPLYVRQQIAGLPGQRKASGSVDDWQRARTLVSHR